MLRLSKKTDYAIILLCHLANNPEPVSAQGIACEYHLPQPMVANILKQLSSSGLVQSRRGQQGGYILLKAPETITIAEIIRITDTTFNLVECVDSAAGCKITQWCPTRSPLISLHERIETFMESLTLGHVINDPKYNTERRDSNETAYLS